MRITCDIDKGIPFLFFTIFKGLILIGKKPDEIIRTKKGFHVIWYNVNIPYETHFAYRKVLGDDEKRIMADLDNKRVSQVLFDIKKIYIKRNGKWELLESCNICGIPLVHFCKTIDGKKYCIKCGSKNVKVLKKLKETKESFLRKVLTKIGVTYKNQMS
ncbi:MAG: hypothetical protein QW609_04255 [Candidatus Aenigmatarchaeota archaeon]